jgi:hypothetical protein
MTTTTLDGSLIPAVVVPGSTVQVNDGDELFLLGTIVNLGTIAVFDASGDGNEQPTLAQLALVVLNSPTVTLTGGGTLAMSGKLDDSVAGSSATVQTLINAGHTISGVGGIGLFEAETIDPSDTFYPIDFVNGLGGVVDATGTVEASGTSQATFIPAQAINITNAGSVLINDGLMEATGIGGLFVMSPTIDQSGGGTILADGAGVVASVTGDEFGNLDLIGGAFEATNGGSIDFQANGGGTLDGSTSMVTLGAGVDLTSGIRFLLGTIDNLGTIAISATVFPNPDLFLVTPTVALIGGGQVVNPIFTNASGSLETLVNGDTLSGVGEIGNGTFDNSDSAAVRVDNLAGGVIDATGTAFNEGGGGFGIGDAIYLFGGGSTSTNAGLMEATGIGGLNLSDLTLDQSGGGTLAASGTGVAVYLQNVTITGGDVETSDGGIIEFNGGSNTLISNGAPLGLAAGGVVEVTSFVSTGTLTLRAGTIDNDGTFIDASIAILTSPTVTLNGTGSVQLSGVLDTNGTTLLINNGNTITGGGDINSAGLAMTNAASGAIEGVGLDAGGTLANAGLLENNSIGFNVATTIDNTGTGMLLANGANVSLFAADIVGGTLAATNGGAFLFGSDEDAAGNSTTLDGRGAPVTIAAGTTLQDFYDSVSPPFTFENDASLSLLGTIDLFGTIEGTDPERIFGGASFAIPNAGLLTGTGTVDGYLSNTGTLLAQGGTLTVTHDVDGSGGISIAAGAAFVLGGESGETVNFGDGANERLILNTPSAFTGTLANLADGDIIDLGTTDIQSAVTIGSTLQVTMTNASTIDYTVSGLPAGTVFTLGAVSSELVVSCFAEGTHIDTPNGPRAVEHLSAGETVLLASGEVEKIMWLGRRRIDLRRHPDPQRASPVRVAAGAFGAGCPRTDLWLSPDHAVFVDGILIPIKRLINGTSIARVLVEEVIYYHIELPRHDVLLAEGLPAESYLDTGDRFNFECGGVIALHPDFSNHVWEAMGCAPLIVTGPRLDAVRRHVEARVAAWRNDALAVA